MANDSYPVRKVSPSTCTFAELPAGSLDLYNVSSEDGWLGIGTPDELRQLVEDGIFPPAERLTFTREWAAA